MWWLIRQPKAYALDQNVGGWKRGRANKGVARGSEGCPLHARLYMKGVDL